MSTLTILARNNLNLLFRSRTSLIAVVVIPLLVLVFAGLAFDTTNIYRVKIGVWAASYSDFGNSVVAMLEDSQFKVARHGSQQECIDAVRLGSEHACMVFSGQFELGAANNVLT